MNYYWHLALILIFNRAYWYSVDTLVTSPHLDEEWELFKKRYNKTLQSDSIAGRKAWEKHYYAVQKHNEEYDKGVHTYKLKINHLADLNRQRYIAKMTKLSKSTKPRSSDIIGLPHHNISAIPEMLDWREQGFRPAEVNQGACGSCYAFSVTTCIEGQYFKMHHKLKNFSSQQVLDCSYSTGNLGCAGGSLRNTLKYLHTVGGLMLDEDYPYEGEQNFCGFNKSRAAVKIKTWGILPPKDENALKVAVSVIGPVALSINAAPTTFQLYSNGIYNDRECSSDYVNHAMLLIGYTKNAWILKNWWSNDWGDHGYMFLARGHNLCGLANYAAFATIV